MVNEGGGVGEDDAEEANFQVRPHAVCTEPLVGEHAEGDVAMRLLPPETKDPVVVPL